jgi:hypothetical protein
MKKVLFSILILSTAFVSCKRDNNNPRNNTYKGPQLQVHGGKAWTWIKLNDQGNPEKLGVSITDEALSSVPIGGTGGHNMHDNMWSLEFNSKVASATPFNHLGMGWNPVGHEPEPIYGRPHFDFHFFIMTPQEVEAIPTYETIPAKFDNWPNAAYFPAGYFNPGGGVPMMGAHWIDPTSGEFNGQSFGQTFIYGSFDGKVTFYEPMITLEFLKNNSNYERTIPQPAKVQKTGYYPTKMRVVKHDGLTEVILDEFVYRVQS